MKAFNTLILFVFVNLAVFGTTQTPDILIYKGKEYRLLNYLMETYFAKYPDKRPECEIISTGLYRGYIATFEIKDNQLFLKEIVIMDDKKDERGKTVSGWKSVLNEIFPNQEYIKVDWITGLLEVVSGEMDDWIKIWSTSDFDYYIVLEVDEGNLNKEKWFERKEYEIFKENQFQAFKETDEYRRLKIELTEERKNIYSSLNLSFNADWYLRLHIIRYSPKILVEQ